MLVFLKIIKKKRNLLPGDPTGDLTERRKKEHVKEKWHADTHTGKAERTLLLLSLL